MYYTKDTKEKRVLHSRSYDADKTWLLSQNNARTKHFLLGKGNHPKAQWLYSLE